MVKAKVPDEMTEGEKIVEELTDHLEDENSKEKEIRQKIDALQQAREKARKALPKAERELCEVLPHASKPYCYCGSLLTDSSAQLSKFQRCRSGGVMTECVVPRPRF